MRACRVLSCARVFLVGSPIGNLGDMPPRAVQVLHDVDAIFAENTTHSLRLLRHFQVPNKPLLHYSEHDWPRTQSQVLLRLQRGETIALLSDAGMPVVSDPGSLLVQLCAKDNVAVSVIPGPCAAVAAIALSGLDTSSFTFVGFLPRAASALHAFVASCLAPSPHTTVFHESPNRLQATLGALQEGGLGERRVVVCRELSKVNETVFRGLVREAVQQFHVHPALQPLGEVTMVLEGCAPTRAAPPQDDERLHALCRAMLAHGVAPSTVSRVVSDVFPNAKRSAVYSLVLQMKGRPKA